MSKDKRIKKTIYRMLPVSLYDITGLEQWLEEQANLGLSPTRIGSYATFSQNGLPGTRYRLEPWGKMGTEPSPEQLDLYRSAGWEYAFPIARTFFLFYTTDPNATELHSDFATRGQSLDRLARRVKRLRMKLLITIPIAILFILAILFWPASGFDIQPDRWARLPLLLLTFANPLFLTLLFAACFEIPLGFRNYRILLNTHQALKEGLPPPPSPGLHKKHATKQVMRSIVQILLILLVSLSLIIKFTVRGGESISNFDLPYVPLSAVEDEPLFTYEELFGESYRYSEDKNLAKRQFSLLAPKWYEVSQYLHSAQAGTQTNSFSPNSEDGKYRYSPSLYMTRFSLLIPGLSKPVAMSQLDAYRSINLHWTYEEIDYPGTDFIILAQEDRGVWQMAALGSGKEVAVFCYGGQKKLSDCLDLLVDMVR